MGWRLGHCSLRARGGASVEMEALLPLGRMRQEAGAAFTQQPDKRWSRGGFSLGRQRSGNKTRAPEEGEGAVCRREQARTRGGPEWILARTHTRCHQLTFCCDELCDGVP